MSLWSIYSDDFNHLNFFSSLIFHTISRQLSSYVKYFKYFCVIKEKRKNIIPILKIDKQKKI